MHRQLRAPPTAHLSDEKQHDVNARIGALMQLLAPMLSEGGGKVDLERWLPQNGVTSASGPPYAEGGGPKEACGGGVNELAAGPRASPPGGGTPEKTGARTPRPSKERYRRTTKERYEVLQAEEAAAVKEWLSSRHSRSSEPLITSQCSHDGFVPPPLDDATQHAAGRHAWICICTGMCMDMEVHMHTYMHAHADPTHARS